MDTEIDREKIVTGLTTGDLEKLTNAQIRAVQRIALQRVNERARTRIESVIKDDVKKVAESLTAPPFIYVSPEIRIMAGCTVRFSSLMTAQLRDAHSQLDEFIGNEQPNDIRMSDFLNRHLLAHSATSFNGQDFGGVSLDAADYQALRSSKPDDAKNMLEEVRNKRLDAIDYLSPHVVQRLVEYYQAFQLIIEELTKSDDMEEALGN